MSLVATHFTNGTRRVRSATSDEDVDEVQSVNSGGKDALPKAQALDMAQRIESLVTKRRASQTTTTDVVARKSSPGENSSKSRISERGQKVRREKRQGFRTRIEAGAMRRRSQKTAETSYENSYGTRGTKRTLRAREKPSSSDGGTWEGGGYDKNSNRISLERGIQEDDDEEEEEAEWEG